MFTVKQPRHFLFSCMVASQSSIFMNWKSLQQNHKNYPFKILANFTDLAKCFRTLWLYCGAHHFCVIHFKLFLLRPDGHYGCDYHQCLGFHSFFSFFNQKILSAFYGLVAPTPHSICHTLNHCIRYNSFNSRY